MSSWSSENLFFNNMLINSLFPLQVSFEAGFDSGTDDSKVAVEDVIVISGIPAQSCPSKNGLLLQTTTTALFLYVLARSILWNSNTEFDFRHITLFGSFSLRYDNDTILFVQVCRKVPMWRRQRKPSHWTGRKRPLFQLRHPRPKMVGILLSLLWLPVVTNF